MAGTTLIIGGARSGKSAFAERMCEDSDRVLVYVATSPRFDNDTEMVSRIEQHKARRGKRWQLVEEEINLPTVISTHSSSSNVLLIDCLTLWLNNIMYRDLDPAANLADLKQASLESKSKLVFISNEVGQGIVPAEALSRRFRDEQGRLNQILARHCDRVVEVRAGIPNLLKPTPQPPITL